MKTSLFTLILAFTGLSQAFGQSLPVPKTNPQKVLVHYMPWFETPATNGGKWGLHWTMANQNPNLIVNTATGQRQIASNYYPLIGPYASSDPAVTEYHLLLMKYCGIDGLLIDFYGNGANDLPLLLRNTNAIIPHISEAGLTFGVVFEDQFDATITAARANMGYVAANYIPQAHYQKINNKPLIGVFGPQKYKTQAEWTTILDTLHTDPTFLTLWYQNSQAGSNADGEFSWVYSDSTAGLKNFYQNRAGTLPTAIGSAWPGFESFYAKGGWGGPSWTIKPADGQTLSQTLALAKQYSTKMAALQLVTWNDFGEGTMLEPTLQTGYTYLKQIQAFTGVAFTQTELDLIHRLYVLRGRFSGNNLAQQACNRVYSSFTQLKVTEAQRVIDSLEAVPTLLPKRASYSFKLSPNPAQNTLFIDQPVPAQATVEIRDLLGRLIKTEQAQNAISVTDLTPGLYQFLLITPEATYTQRFVKE